MSTSSRKARRRQKGSNTMRAWPIDVTENEFNSFLYPYGTNIASKDVKEHLVSLRLVEKLQDPEITKKAEISQDKIDAAEEAGEMVWAMHKLAVPEHTFLLEEDEKRLLLQRLEKNVGRVPPAIGYEFELLRQKFLNAEPIDITPAKEEPDITPAVVDLDEPAPAVEEGEL